MCVCILYACMCLRRRNTSADLFAKNTDFAFILFFARLKIIQQIQHNNRGRPKTTVLYEGQLKIVASKYS